MNTVVNKNCTNDISSEFNDNEVFVEDSETNATEIIVATDVIDISDSSNKITNNAYCSNSNDYLVEIDSEKVFWSKHK